MLDILVWISIWLLTGLIIYAIKVFLYCRGPTHYLQMNIWILETMKNPQVKIFKEFIDSGSGYQMVLGAFIIASILGPLILLDFIRFVVNVNKCTKIEQKNKTAG